jgi:tetratricopeptide (TPR) repeat protein
MSENHRHQSTSIQWGKICLLVAACLLLGLWPENQALVATIRQGNGLVSEQRYGAALDIYAVASTLCPGCPYPHLARRKVYVTQGRYTEAWKEFLKAISLGGTSDETTEAAAQLYLAQGAPELAVEMLHTLLRRRPVRADWWVWLAESYLDLENRDLAQQAFARALGMALSEARRQHVHNKMAMLCFVESDLDCALTHLEEVAVGPGPVLAANAQELLAALAGLKQGIDPALAMAKLGQALFEAGDLVLARQQFQRAVDLEPAYVDGHAYLGYVLSLLGEAELAAQHLTRAIELEPTYPLPYYFQGMHYAHRGWWITARDVLVQAHDLDPTNPAICVAVAETYLQAQDPLYAAAERWLHAAVDNAPDDMRFHLLLAHFYVDYGIDPGLRGIAAAQMAVNLAPESSEAYETLGWAYHLSGKPDLALEPLLRAQALAPSEPRIDYRLGQVYDALGQRKPAVAYYQRAMDLDWDGTIGTKALRALEHEGKGANYGME